MDRWTKQTNEWSNGWIDTWTNRQITYTQSQSKKIKVWSLLLAFAQTSMT